MNIFLVFLITIIGSYLIGSIPWAIITGKLFRNMDVREYGSGNAGATNVFRVFGAKIAVVVAILDAAKGLSAVFIARYALLPPIPEISVNLRIFVLICAAIFVILGHIFTIFAGFKGGKGVAAGAGALFALLPLLATVSLIVFILVLLFAGYVSLASISAALIMPITYAVLSLLEGKPVHVIWILFLVLAASLIAFSHRKNIGRLIRGEENRFKTLWFWIRRDRN